jgi:hypothetical protein
LGQGENRRIFRRLLKDDLLPLIRGKKGRELDRRLYRTLGPGFSRKEMGFKW